MSLSPAATIVLTRAADRPDRRLEFHRKLPTGGRHKMIDALLREGLIAETQGDYRLGDGALLIESTATGLMLTTLALTDAGFRAKLTVACDLTERQDKTSTKRFPLEIEAVRSGDEWRIAGMWQPEEMVLWQRRERGK